jgi:hypothetical protein
MLSLPKYLSYISKSKTTQTLRSLNFLNHDSRERIGTQILHYAYAPFSMTMRIHTFYVLNDKKESFCHSEAKPNPLPLLRAKRSNPSSFFVLDCFGASHLAMTKRDKKHRYIQSHNKRSITHHKTMSYHYNNQSQNQINLISKETK